MPRDTKYHRNGECSKLACCGLACLDRTAVLGLALIKCTPVSEANSNQDAHLCLCRISTSWDPAPCILSGDVHPSTSEDNDASRLVTRKIGKIQGAILINRGERTQSKSQGLREGERDRRSACSYY